MLPYSHTGLLPRGATKSKSSRALTRSNNSETISASAGASSICTPTITEMLANEHLDIVSVTTSAKPRPDIVQDHCRGPASRRSSPRSRWRFSLAEADAMVAVVPGTGHCARCWLHPALGCLVDRCAQAHRRWADRQVAADQCAWANAGISHNGSHMIDLVRFLVGNTPVDLGVG